MEWPALSNAMSCTTHPQSSLLFLNTLPLLVPSLQPGVDWNGQHQASAMSYVTRTQPLPLLIEDDVLPLPVPLLQPGVDWNGQRYHHIDAHQLPDGSWLAAMDGDK